MLTSCRESVRKGLKLRNRYPEPEHVRHQSQKGRKVRIRFPPARVCISASSCCLPRSAGGHWCDAGVELAGDHEPPAHAGAHSSSSIEYSNWRSSRVTLPGIRSASGHSPAAGDRFGGSTDTGLAYASIASHSLSFDHRLRFRALLTAIASAFRCQREAL